MFEKSNAKKVSHKSTRNADFVFLADLCYRFYKILIESSGVQSRFIDCNMQPDTVYLLNIAWSSSGDEGQDLGIALTETIECAGNHISIIAKKFASKQYLG